MSKLKLREEDKWNLELVIESAVPDLREITFHSDGKVIAKTGANAKRPKKLYAAKPPKSGPYSQAYLIIKALHKLIKENE